MTFYPKNGRKFPKSHDSILCVFACFGVDFSLQSALPMPKRIVKSCCEYLKHSLNSEEYVSKKIMVIRCVEMNIKQENDVSSQKRA